jgi:hypothetical protein
MITFQVHSGDSTGRPSTIKQHGRKIGNRNQIKAIVRRKEGVPGEQLVGNDSVCDVTGRIVHR